ncbi:MAG TPA: O-antigen polysaccharide polymerase Wzy, partial [Verrucomicrobiae bacterium]|nr:O-antigen polysaccharide polymerase Wzy [Verrucomicrobiae bacterium]
CLVMSGLTLFFGRIGLFSFPGGFLGVSGLYLVGLLLAFALQGDVAFAVWHVVDMEAILCGIPLVMLAFTGFFIGCIWAVTRRLAESENPPPAAARFARRYALVAGGALFGLAVALILFETLRGAGLMYAMEGGYFYLAEMQYGGGGLGLAWAALVWFLPWGVIILTAAAERKRDLWWVIPVLLIANAILVISGDRGGLFVLDLVAVMRVSLLGFRLRWWQSLGLAALIIVTIPTLMVLRQLPSRNWTADLVLEALTSKSDGALGTDPISATLIEGGLSYKVLMGTLAFVPAREDYHYGADYIRSLAVAVPFFSRIMPDLVQRNDLWVKDYVDHQLSIAGIGFLQLAEAYVQFGAWGVLGFYLLMGFGVPYLWRCCKERPLSSCQLAYALILADTVLLWIRNEFDVVVKPVVWCFILLIILPKILGRFSMARRPEGTLPAARVGRPRISAKQLATVDS